MASASGWRASSRLTALLAAAGRSGMVRLGWLLAVGVVVFGACSSPAYPQVKKENRSAVKASDAPKPADIDRNGILILVRSILLALDQANKTGNYSVLRDLGAPVFQVNNAARLAEVFSTQRKEKWDMSGVATLEPQLTQPPQIESNGMLHIVGFFPSAAAQLNFEFLFAPDDRQWKISGMAVRLGSTAPQAPDNPPIPSPAPSTEKPDAPSGDIVIGKPAGKK